MKPCRKVPATAVALLLLLTVLGCNESSSPTAPGFPPVSASYSVFGVITGASSHAPLEGARIEVTGVIDRKLYVTASDGKGLFRISGLQAALYLVAVSKEGFERSERSVDLSASNSTNVAQDFLLFEKGPVPLPGGLTGEWRGTISIENDPQDDQAPCPTTEQVAGKIEHSGSAVTADLSGKCNRALHFEGFIQGGSLTGTITLTFPQETFTGSATGTASSLRVLLNATLRSEWGHTIQGLEIALTH